MDETTLFHQIRQYVQKYDDVRDLQFEAVPYPLDSHEGVGYLLLVASINQNTAAERVRDVVRRLYDHLGDDLLHIDRIPPEQYLDQVKEFQPRWEKIWKQLPKILSSASQFIEQSERTGGMVEWGRGQHNALTAAEQIATGIYYMGRDPSGARKKSWMFLRWMVRPYPDLGLWSPALSPADLRVPLDVNTGRVFLYLSNKYDVIAGRMTAEGLVFEIDEWGNMASTANNVATVTTIARWFFADDPARVDYPFFQYARQHL